MDVRDLREVAAGLPRAWASMPFAGIAGARLKVLRMDAAPYPPEVHDHDEALLVLEGRMLLQVQDREKTLEAGEVFVVPAGTRHGVAAGSHGTLLVVDPDPAATDPTGEEHAI
jgi:quercetin dioxygenase-like cupin family protein